jgi:hypothetical protein
MHHERFTVVEIEQKILSPAPGAANRSSGEPGAGDLDCKIAHNSWKISRGHSFDRPPDHERVEAESNCFDFREFWHRF